MFASLRARLWLTYALMIAIVLAILSASLLIYLVRNPVEERQSLLRLTVAAESIARLGDSNLGQIPAARLQEIMTRTDERTGFRVLVLSGNATVVADSRAGDSPPLIFQQPQIRRGMGLVQDGGGQSWLYALRPVGDGFFLATASARERRLPAILNILSDEFLPPFVQAGAIALAIALFLAVLIARWISAPLRRMSEATRRVSAGEYQQLRPEGPTEVQTLAKAFNEMTRKVQSSQVAQRDFVANVSHELKTPLTSIQGFAGALLDGTVSSQPEVKQAAGIIHNEAERMHRMVIDLLDLARLDTGTMELDRSPIDAHQLLERVTRKFAPQAAGAGIQLSLDAAALPLIVGDHDRLVQVFTNLIDNAIKYTPEGGKVQVHATRVEDSINIAVSDSGQGIEPDELSRVFERFYQTDRSRGGGRGRGAGLGLAIASEIVRAHGGRIFAQSKVGQGSRFTVSLPIIQPDDTTLAARRAGSRDQR